MRVTKAGRPIKLHDEAIVLRTEAPEVIAMIEGQLSLALQLLISTL